MTCWLCRNSHGRASGYMPARPAVSGQTGEALISDPLRPAAGDHSGNQDDLEVVDVELPS
jgi:hypothetical protein